MKLKNIIYNLFILALAVLTACEAGTDSMSSTGQGGSLACFAIQGDILYTVSERNLFVFDISNDSKPELFNKIDLVSSDVETIFAKDSMLFLGTASGMLIYNISDPKQPVYISRYDHIVSCDPVVVNDSLAFVTLHSSSGNSRCWNNVNELHIVDITDFENPQQIASYQMSYPLGLGLKGDTLFLCDQGLKVYDVSNPLDIQLLNTFSITANDVIVLDDILLVIGSNALYEYKFENNEITLLSSLEICHSNLIE